MCDSSVLSDLVQGLNLLIFLNIYLENGKILLEPRPLKIGQRQSLFVVKVKQNTLLFAIITFFAEDLHNNFIL